jgi:hypothetical protein
VNAWTVAKRIDHEMTRREQDEMLLEIQEGESVTVEKSVVSVVSVRSFDFANSEGKIQVRRAAALEVGGRRIEVEEGSMVELGDDSTAIVVGIRRQDKIGLVRLSSRDRQGRLFKYAREGYESKGRQFDLGMSMLVLGVSGVNEVLSRLDDHADAIPRLLVRLEEATTQLGHARKFLPRNNRPAPLDAYVDRCRGLCDSLRNRIRWPVDEAGSRRTNESKSAEVVLSYCDVCGLRVQSYPASTTRLNADPPDESRAGIMFYDCSRCGETHPSHCPEDTGFSCRRCDRINRMGSRHCAYCGELMPY